MKELQLSVQNAWNGIGVLDKVIFSWKYMKKNVNLIQKKYCISIRRKGQIVYTSGWIESNRQNQVACIFEMEENSKYYAVVETEDISGIHRMSDEIIFITGIREEGWKAKWISTGEKKPFLAFKTFNIENVVEEAVIAICGMGQFLAKLNGEKISTTVLDGSWTDYDRTVPYRTFDVSGMLKEGRNILTVEVGNGWYLGDTTENRHFYTKGEHAYHEYGSCLCCRVQLSIITEREKFSVITDHTWKVWKSDILMTNVYGSEDQDASRRITEEILSLGKSENAEELEKERCPKGKMTASIEPPIIIKKSYTPLSEKKIGKMLIYDLGQNMSGIFEIKSTGPKGSRIKVIPAEKIGKDGIPIPSVNTYSWYTLSGRKEDVFCPKFSYSAGRWIMIEADGVDLDQAGIQILEVTGHFITSAAEKCGTFKTSDKRYEQILELVENAIDSNLNYVHTDCPTVEKLGWLETSHLMASSVMFLRNVATLWSKIASDMRDAQYRLGEKDVDINDENVIYESGLIPSIAPRYACFLHACEEGSFWDIVPWGSSIIFSSYWQECFYNDRGAVEDNYETAVKYVKYLWGKYQDYNKIYNKEGKNKFLCHGLGDWGIEQGKGRSRENIETAFLYQDLRVLSKWAEKLGKPDYDIWNKQAAEVRERYNEALLKKGEDGEWFYDSYDSQDIKITQVNQAIPLEFGMVPKEKLESVRKSFVKSISDGKIDSGEIGLRYVFHQAAECGQQDKVHEMIMQKEHPSYYRFIEKGETTLPEFWRDDARSRNHDMMGHIVEWFYRNVAGIWSEDGYQTIYIQPDLPSQIQWVECTYESIAGSIKVFCCLSEKDLILHVEIPPNTIGKIKCPNQEKIEWEKNNITVKGGGIIEIKGKRRDGSRNQMVR